MDVEEHYFSPSEEQKQTVPQGAKISKVGDSYSLVESESREILSFDLLERFLPSQFIKALEQMDKVDKREVIDERNTRLTFQNDLSLSPLTADEIAQLASSEYNPVYRSDSCSIQSLRQELQGISTDRRAKRTR